MQINIREHSYFSKKKCIWNSENNAWVEKYNNTKYYNCVNKMLNIGTSKLNSY